VKLRRIKSSLPRPYAPEVNDFSLPFWQALERNEFLLARCGSCQTLQFPPRPLCPSCGGSEIEWQPASGRGTLYASSRVHAAAGPFACMTPYTVGIVDLEEGARILTRIMHDASSLLPGSAVQIAVLEHCDGPLFVAVNADQSG
jgi:uncharacterized OB-fold protein